MCQTPHNHSSMTLSINFTNNCQIKRKLFCLPTLFQSRDIDPSLCILKGPTNHKIAQANIHKLSLHLKHEDTC